MNRRLASALLEAGVAACLPLQATPTGSAGKDADLVKELQNPVADLISIPTESRFDVGAGKLQRYTLTLQPVLPLELGTDLLLVSRTVLPVIHDTGTATGDGSRTGLGDTMQSFFLAPKGDSGGLIYGAGPVLRLPTATERSLGDGVWGAGPTAVVLYQGDVWTSGILANHVWSFAGRPGATFNGSYVQPFLAYTTESSSTFGLAMEAAYDWKAGQRIVPVDASYSRLVRVGASPLNFSVGIRKYVSRPAGGPDWGANCTLTFLLPK